MIAVLQPKRSAVMRLGAPAKKPSRGVTGCAVALYHLLLLASIASAATHIAPSAKAPRMLQAFDPTVDHLPAGFTGNDFMAVFKAKTSPKKGEFETGDQYRQRQKALQGESYYAFQYSTLLRYDADRQGFRVTVFGDRLKGEAGLLTGDMRAIIVGESRKIVGHYSGSNAYGARVVVSKRVGVELAVAVSGAFMREDDALGHEFFLPMPSRQASLTKASLTFLLVFKPEPHEAGALTMTATDYYAPEISTPIEQTITWRYIFGGDASLWAYDKRTGEIFGKFALVGDLTRAPDAVPGPEGKVLDGPPPL
jgi:hypothetical protein